MRVGLLVLCLCVVNVFFYFTFYINIHRPIVNLSFFLFKKRGLTSLEREDGPSRWWWLRSGHQATSSCFLMAASFLSWTNHVSSLFTKEIRCLYTSRWIFSFIACSRFGELSKGLQAVCQDRRIGFRAVCNSGALPAPNLLWESLLDSQRGQT